MWRSLIPYAVMFFLEPDFLEPTDRKNAPILRFSAPAYSLLLKELPQKQIILSLDTLSSIVRGHCLQWYILDRFAQVVSHHLLTGVKLLI
jgi:hypothetical protein